MKNVLLVVDDDGVARVVATLVTSHYAEAGSDQVYDLPFALISPLQTYYATVLCGLDLIRNGHLCLSAGLSVLQVME